MNVLELFFIFLARRHAVFLALQLLHLAVDAQGPDDFLDSSETG